MEGRTLSEEIDFIKVFLYLSNNIINRKKVLISLKQVLRNNYSIKFFLVAKKCIQQE